ncbi:probable cytochrome P450 49a1 [Galendromus occidentalis]|uniref:Probable cytochrome P450 49a1 n=1 Tax=Galendromus occidentalis TaxID=34638 RepID=A0AAJ6QP59_9ACAR|nr:probable cytochrome P450 49a1 [Galendromus occidentalis]
MRSLQILHVGRRFCSGAAARPFNDIPKMFSLPYFGSNWIYWPVVGGYDPDKPHHVARDIHRKHGDIVVERLGGRYPLVHLFNADDFEVLYKSEGRTPFRVGSAAFKKYRSSRPQWYHNIGYLTMQGEEWYNYRSKTQPYTLKPRTIMSYVPSMNDVADEAIHLIEEYQNQYGLGNWNCLRLLYKWSLESVLYVALDKRLNCLQTELDTGSDADRVLKSMDVIFECLQIFGYRMPLWRYFRTPSWKRFEDSMDDFTEVIFRNIKGAQKQPDEDKEMTILQHMLSRDDLLYEDIVALMSDFLLGGADTTSNTASFLLYNMAVNPEAQERAHEEAKKLMVGRSSDAVTAKDLNDIPYIKACLKESLRLFPSITGVYRKFDKDVVFSGYNVPKGTVVFADFYITGRNPKYFEEPEKFKPERWLKKGEGHAYGSLPFSFGPRMCLGRRVAELELWVLMIKLMQNFRLEYRGGEMDFRGKLVNTPDQDLKIAFNRRT